MEIDFEDFAAFLVVINLAKQIFLWENISVCISQCKNGSIVWSEVGLIISVV